MIIRNQVTRTLNVDFSILGCSRSPSGAVAVIITVPNHSLICGHYREKRFLSCYEIEHPTPNYRKECQNLSKKNLFTIARHSSAKKARKGALLNPRQIKNRGEKAWFLHTRHGCVHVFSPYLVPFCGFVSTPKNKTATQNFFLALTFWSQRCLFFAKSSTIGWMTTI